MSLHIDMQVVYSCQQLVPSFVRKGMKEWRGMLGHRKPRLFHEYLSPSIHFSIMDRLKVFVYMSLRACVFVCESACVLVCVHRCVCIIVWARRLWLVWAWGSLCTINTYTVITPSRIPCSAVCNQYIMFTDSQYKLVYTSWPPMTVQLWSLQQLFVWGGGCAGARACVHSSKMLHLRSRLKLKQKISGKKVTIKNCINMTSWDWKMVETQMDKKHSAKQTNEWKNRETDRFAHKKAWRQKKKTDWG